MLGLEEMGDPCVPGGAAGGLPSWGGAGEGQLFSDLAKQAQMKPVEAFRQSCNGISGSQDGEGVCSGLRPCRGLEHMGGGRCFGSQGESVRGQCSAAFPGRTGHPGLWQPGLKSWVLVGKEKSLKIGRNEEKPFPLLFSSSRSVS